MGKHFLSNNKMSKAKAQSKVVNTSGWDARPWTRPGLGEEQVMEIKDAFDLFDRDGSGALEFNEFYELLTARFSENTSKEELQRVFKLFDTDATGSISVENMKAVAEQVGDQ